MSNPYEKPFKTTVIKDHETGAILVRLPVESGQEFWTLIPHSEAAMHTQIAGTIRMVRAFNEENRMSASVISNNGVEYSSGYTLGELGVTIENGMMWAYHVVNATEFLGTRIATRIANLMFQDDKPPTGVFSSQVMDICQTWERNHDPVHPHRIIQQDAACRRSLKHLIIETVEKGGGLGRDLNILVYNYALWLCNLGVIQKVYVNRIKNASRPTEQTTREMRAGS